MDSTYSHTLDELKEAGLEKLRIIDEFNSNIAEFKKRFGHFFRIRVAVPLDSCEYYNKINALPGDTHYYYSIDEIEFLGEESAP
jgi:hypothetical protein